MLDKEIARLAREQIRLEIPEQVARLQAEISHTRAEFARRGLLNSSIALQNIAQLCAKAAKERGEFGWKTLRRYVTEGRAPYHDRLASDLKVIADEFLSSTDDLKALAKEGSQHFASPNIAAELERLVEDARATTLAKIGNEIDLFVLSLKNRSASAQEGRAEPKRDALTQLLDRGEMDADITQLFAEAASSRHPLSVVLVDVDHFKNVNDTHGHQKGDAVLTEVAKQLLSVTEGKGRVYRYGGEEILVLLPNHAIQEAIAVAERARCSLESAQPGGLNITASFGIGTYPDHGTTTAMVLEAADKAMYEAKRCGRNVVRVFGEPPPSQPEKSRQPTRKLPTPGGLTEEERDHIRLQYFRTHNAMCPKDGAILTVYESQPIGEPTASLLIHCKYCGLREQL